MVNNLVLLSVKFPTTTGEFIIVFHVTFYIRYLLRAKKESFQSVSFLILIFDGSADFREAFESGMSSYLELSVELLTYQTLFFIFRLH